jgi:hypothetical protein
MSEVSASLDKKRFSFADDTKSADALIVYGGRSFDIWNSDTGDYFGRTKPYLLAELQKKRANQIRIKSSAFYGLSESWANEPGLADWTRPRIAYRDISRSTDSRTIRAALIPPNTILNNTAPYLVRRAGTEVEEAFLLGVLCSIPFDWAMRQIIELHASPFIVKEFSVPKLESNEICNRIISISTSLAAVDNRLSSWARAVGIKFSILESDTQKDSFIAELDALVAHLYGLSRSQLEHVFKTFHRGWDYSSRLAQVLAFYDQLPKVKS